MSNKSIPVKDQNLVLSRLAQGMSTRDAIKGTVISSNSTAALLAKRQSHKIAQYRKDYLFAIEHQTGASRSERARMWGAMIYATKHVITNHYIDYDKTTGKPVRMPLIDDVPDWKMRERALRYLDALEESVVGGSSVTNNKVQVNLISDSENFMINSA